MEHDEWTNEKYLSEAKREPKRVEFYKQYFDNELEVAQCVCDNPPSFDRQFKEYYPTRKSYEEKNKTRSSNRP
jgi:hypothetical protein